MRIIQHHLCAEEIARALDGKRTGADRYRARCPAHDDRNPSFDITDKDGKVLFKCWSGCTQNEVIAALIDRGLWLAPGEEPKDSRIRFSPDEIETMQLFAMTYEGDCGRGVQPTSIQAALYAEYVRVLKRENAYVW